MCGLWQDDGAVSAIVGTVLLVTVLFAVSAGVVVLVEEYGRRDVSVAEPIAWVSDEADDRLAVVTAPRGADWSEYEILTDVGLRVGLGAPPTLSSGHAVGPGSSLVLPEAIIEPGHVLRFCGEETGVGVAWQDVAVQFVHRASGRLLYHFEFVDIAACS